MPVRIRILFWIGLISCAALGVAHLALTGIYQGDADTTLEWALLQICAGVMVAFHVAVFGHLAAAHLTRGGICKTTL